MLWGALTPKLYFLSWRPPKGTSLRRNTRFEPSLVVIGPTVWSGRDAKSTKKRTNSKPKFAIFADPLPIIPHPPNFARRIVSRLSPSWFWVSERSVENLGAVGGRIFGFPIDLAHRLYNSLLLSHKPWLFREFYGLYLFESLLSVYFLGLLSLDGQQ